MRPIQGDVSFRCGGAYRQLWEMADNMETDRKLFGEVAFEKGYVTTEALYEALTIQAKAEVTGKPYMFLGQILIELGHMSEAQVLEVLSELHTADSLVS